MQKNSRNIERLIALFILLMVGSAFSSFAAANRKPNVVFILADDMGYGDIGSYGQKLIHTPNLDQLAKEGTRFTQCYAGNTVCAPSRCTLMTGFHNGHARVRGNDGSHLQQGDLTVAQILKDAGYKTGLIGKWGLGNEDTSGVPTKHGFDYSFGYLDQTHAHDYWTDHLFRNGQRVEIPPKTYSHDLFAQEALDFIKREKDKPFFLYLPFTIPHANFDPPTDEPYSKEGWTPQNKKLAAMITRLDRDVGRIMALLKELNLENDTIVFFTSDNGPREQGADFFKSSGPFRGIKRDLYEGGIREPMIVRWPNKIKAGATSEQIFTFWDFLPTAAEIAGVKLPEKIDGISVLPALLGQPQKTNHEFLYWEFYERGFQQAVRMGDWKAVRLGRAKPWELYNLRGDISETKDVAAQNPQIMEKIEAYLKTGRTEYIKNGERKQKAEKTK